MVQDGQAKAKRNDQNLGGLCRSDQQRPSCYQLTAGGTLLSLPRRVYPVRPPAGRRSRAESRKVASPVGAGCIAPARRAEEVYDEQDEQDGPEDVEDAFPGCRLAVFCSRRRVERRIIRAGF